MHSILKYAAWLLFILFFPVFCRKSQPDDLYWGETLAIKNGESWTGKPRCAINKPYAQGIDLLVDVFNEHGFWREDLHFYKIPLTVGAYKLSVDSDIHMIDSTYGAAYYTFIDDGHVIGSNYKLIELDGIENFIAINKKKNDEIWGTYQAAFLKYYSESPLDKDTVIFRNGTFHTKISEE